MPYSSVSSDQESSDPTLMMYGRQRYWTPAPRIPAADGSRAVQALRPGWPSPPQLPPTPMTGRGAYGRAPTQNQGSCLICHTCYQRYHVIRECMLPARDLHVVVANYEALTDAERTRVPAESYLRAKSAFTSSGRPSAAIPSALPQPQPRSSSPTAQVPRILPTPPRSPGNRPRTPRPSQSPSPEN